MPSHRRVAVEHSNPDGQNPVEPAGTGIEVANVSYMELGRPGVDVFPVAANRGVDHLPRSVDG